MKFETDLTKTAACTLRTKTDRPAYFSKPISKSNKNKVIQLLMIAVSKQPQTQVVTIIDGTPLKKTSTAVSVWWGPKDVLTPSSRHSKRRLGGHQPWRCLVDLFIKSNEQVEQTRTRRDIYGVRLTPDWAPERCASHVCIDATCPILASLGSLPPTAWRQRHVEWTHSHGHEVKLPLFTLRWVRQQTTEPSGLWILARWRWKWRDVGLELPIEF